MGIPRTESLPPPPNIIGALKTGFDAVAAHIWAISMPLVLDILLWLGPRLRMDELVWPVLNSWPMTGNLINTTEQVKASKVLYAHILGYFNLFDLLRTFPVGVSSLMSWWNSRQVFTIRDGESLDLPVLVQTPLGQAPTIQVSSLLGLMAWFCLLTLLGWLIGSMYFYWTSRLVPLDTNLAVLKLSAVMMHTLLVSIIWTVILFILAFPLILILFVFSLLGPTLAYLSLICIGAVVVWLLLPIFFSAHGIFLRGQDAFRSILAAFSLVRYTAPTTSLFAMAVIVLSQGLNMLWVIPGETSWVLLIGIAGHAFISTALLAASFSYYHDTSIWLQAALEKVRQRGAVQQV